VPAPPCAPPLPDDAVPGPEPPEDCPPAWPGGFVQPGAEVEGAPCPLDPAGWPPAEPGCPPLVGDDWAPPLEVDWPPPAEDVPPPALPDDPEDEEEEDPEPCEEDGDWLPELVPPEVDVEPLLPELEGVDDGGEGIPDGIVGMDTEHAATQAAQSAAHTERSLSGRCMSEILGEGRAPGRGPLECYWMRCRACGSTAGATNRPMRPSRRLERPSCRRR
jgi:hypothetical protein